MSKASRDKGMRRERQLVEMHRVLGVRAERTPLSGATPFRNSVDIDIYPFGAHAEPWVGECKARASGEGFVQIKKWLGEADFLALMEDREKPLIVLPWERWQELLLALKKPITVTPAMSKMLDEAMETVE